MRAGFVTVAATVMLEAALQQMQQRDAPPVVLENGKVAGPPTRENVGELFALQDSLRPASPG
jgi:hypothetical protein